VKPVARALVIKLGGVGEFVQAFPAFERIREAHPKAKITLLTTDPFLALAKSSPWFNAVEIDGRPKGPAAWLSLITRIRQARYDRIYDLQNDAHSGTIFQALRPFAPEWSGAAAGASLPFRDPGRARMHPLERNAAQLGAAGIWPDAPTRPLSAPPPLITWPLPGAGQTRTLAGSARQRPLVLLIPGGETKQAEKRWPIERYGALAKKLQDEGFDMVILGGLDESPLAHAIQRAAPRTRDLTGRTDFAQIASLGARAALAVGNDTGALHLVTAAGAPTIGLFSAASDPDRNGPRGHVTVLQSPDLKNLAVDTVTRAALALAQQEP